MFRLGVGDHVADVFIALGGGIATKDASPLPASAGASQTLQTTPPLAKALLQGRSVSCQPVTARSAQHVHQK